MPSPAPKAMSTIGYTQNLWDKAVETLSDNEKQQINLSQQDKLTILHEVLVAVEEKKKLCLEKRWKYKNRKGETVILRHVFDKVTEWIDKFKQIGDVAVQYDPAHAALPWAAVRLVLQIAVSDSQTFGEIVEGIELVSNLITRYAIFEALYLQRASAAKDQLTQSMVKFYGAILKFLLKAVRYYDRNTASTFASMRIMRPLLTVREERIAVSVVQTAGMGVEPYIRKVLEEQSSVDACARLVDAEYRQHMDSAVQNLQGSFTSLNRENHQELKRILTELEKPISQSATQLSDLHDSLKKSERLACFQWMSTIPHRIHHKTMVKDCLPGLGGWLFEKTEFIEWRKSSVSSILWLHGIPGSGKTKLVSLVIEYFFTEYSANTRPTPISYFYCARNSAEPQRADPEEILRSILKQLSSSKSELPIREPVASIYKERRDEAEEDGCEPTKLSLAECIELILALTEINPAIIIIDALDECDPARRHELLMALERVIQESASLVKVFVSSRDDNDIVCRLDNCSNVLINANDNGKDIEDFVSRTLTKAIEDKRLLGGQVSEELKSRIIATLIRGAQGMFRWVSLQIQNLCNAQRMRIEADIAQELGRLPQSLADLYALTYDQISQSGPQSRLIADKAMKWLLCAQRPLGTEEFIAAISVSSGGQYTKLSSTDLLSICCNLVVLDAELDVFRFAHLSVREFLEGIDNYSISEIHALATERCIDAFTVDLGHKRPPDLVIEQSDVFQPYAALYWPTHYKIAGNSQHEEKLRAKVTLFLLHGCEPAPSFVYWLLTAKEAVKPLLMDNPLRNALVSTFSSPPNALFLACSYGVTTIAEDMRRHNYRQWDHRNDNSDSGLHLAAAGGHDELVRLLLKEGAGTTARDNHLRTALHRAAAAGSDLVVRELLANGAYIDARDTDGATALFTATSHGYTEVAQTLLENQATTEITYRNRWTALQKAADCGHLKIVRLLLAHGSNVHSESTRGLIALHRAAGKGHKAISLHLLEQGSGIETKTIDGWTPLHGAASAGQESTIALLLDWGGDINARSGDRRTPLHKACRGRHQQAASMLIRRGADIMARDEAGRIPLHDAAERGSEAIIETLLQCDERLRQSQLEAEDSTGHTADQIAIAAGQLEVARLLRGQETAFRGTECELPTELDIAIENGDVIAASRLIEQGADVESLGYDGLTLLHRAAWYNSGDIIKLLLSRGAHPEITTPDGWTPLHCAARATRETSVRMLLNAGANVTARTDNGQTPLHKSCQGGSEEVVQLLITAGAPTEARDAKRRTPLHEAAEYGNEAIARLLIEHGTNITARDIDGITPQYAANIEGHRSLAESLSVQWDAKSA
ncbi:MAG: hypothetical protein M1839_002801 [Geoglossum umbratile]|nr:MAG: hypothetical protein M1839_002801 [Geoglossum umbratile]